MNKKRMQNCLSKEKKTFESNIKKYKTLMEAECESNLESKCKTKLESVPTISEYFISEPVASTSASGLFSNFLVTPSVIPRDFKEPHPELSAPSIKDEKNEDILSVLKQITQGQKELNKKLEKLEQNQTNILQNQSILSNGQLVIVGNQKVIADKIEKIEANIVSKPEMMAQSKLLMECKISIKRVEKSVCRMTGEIYDNKIYEVASILPLNTLASVEEVEQKLGTPDFAQAMTTHLFQLKGSSEDVSSVIREIFTDDLLMKYNWEGRWEKHALGKLMLFNKTLRDVFQEKGALEFEKSVRKAVERSHHRVKQKKYLRKEK